MGGIAHFGDKRGFGLVGNWAHDHLPQAGKTMYAGAFLYVVIGVFGMIPLAIMWIGVILVFVDDGGLMAELGEVEEDSVTSKPYSAIIGMVSFRCLFSTWLASWLFWVGYLQLTDPVDKYATQH